MKGCSPQGRGTGDGGTGAEGQTEMKNKQLDNALKVGDPVTVTMAESQSAMTTAAFLSAEILRRSSA
jgi:hypothetical protein